MKRAPLPRPRGAELSPDTDAPPELAALAANLRARWAFWGAVHSRDIAREGLGTMILPGGIIVSTDKSFPGLFSDARAAAIDPAAAAPVTARFVWRTVEALTPRRLWRAMLQRPSLAWRYPVMPVARETEEPAAIAAAYLDGAAVVLGAAELPPHAGVAERVRIPPRHAVAAFGDGEVPAEAMRDATRCVPWAAIDPAGVPLADVLAALRACPDRDARAAAEVIGDAVAVDDAEGNDVLQMLHARGLSHWSPWGVAAVLFTLREVLDVHGRHQGFALPTTKPANAAVVNITGGAKPSAWKGTPQKIDPATGLPSARKVVLRVQWEGKILPTQLCLELGEDVTGEALAAVLDHMADDGLRDWLALHAMADEQGNTGDVRWTWEHHKHTAGYAARVAACGTTKSGERETDDTLRRAVIARFWQFTRAALWEDGGKRMRRVGDGPFAKMRAIGDPEGLEQERDDFTDALLSINRVLYRGAHRDARGAERHFTGVTPAVFGLRGGALRLAVFILRAERMHRDQGLRVRFTERELMRYARVRGDGKPSAKHMDAARAELARYVAAVVDAFNQVETPGSLAAMTPDPSTPGVYHWTPARWRVEREQLGAAAERPALPPSDRPYTGAALRVWREARELSQRDAAKVLKVGFRTVQRAEMRPAEALPRSFDRPGVPWGITGAAAAELGAGPVEGEDEQGGEDGPGVDAGSAP